MLTRLLGVGLYLFCSVWCLSISAQTTVKMYMGKQADKALEVLTLFDEPIPEGIPMVLGVQGYEVIGGMQPYTYEWLQNNMRVGTSTSVQVIPSKGDVFSLQVRDAYGCKSADAFTLRLVRLNGDEDMGKRIHCFLQNQLLHVQFKQALNVPAVLRVVDLQGRQLLYMQTLSDLNLPLAYSASVLVVYIETEWGNYTFKLEGSNR